MNEFQHQSNRPSDNTSKATAAAQQERRQRFGERIRAARYAAHLTQVDLGGATFSKSYISALERGKTMPSVQALRILAERLGVRYAFLLGEELLTPEEEATPSVPGEEVSASGDAAFQEGRARLRSQAEGCLREGRYEEALALGAQAEEPALLSRIHDAYATFLAEQGRYKEAYEQLRLGLTYTRLPPSTG